MDGIDAKLILPQRLDDPAKFLWWDFDVAILAMGCLCLGMLVNQLGVFAVGAVIVAQAYQKLKAGRAKAFGLHAVYWYLPVTFGFRATPPSAIREYIG